MLNTSPFSVLVHDQAARFGDETVMTYRDYERNEWLPVSWDEFSAVVRRVSASLLALGVGVQENLAVFSQNKPECLYVDFGAYGIRAVTIPFYATSSESQVTYMVNDAQVRYVFVGGQYQYDTQLQAFNQQKQQAEDKLADAQKEIDDNRLDARYGKQIHGNGDDTFKHGN